MSCKDSNGEWYIIKSTVKVEINDVTISKSLWFVREDILNALHVRKHYFLVTRRIASYFEGFFS